MQKNIILKKLKIIVVGGGAAGFFAANIAAEKNPKAEIIVLERGKEVLQKVKVSGGGRCNVTHDCLNARELTKFYPRGERELFAPFTRFAVADTIDWFSKRGVKIKTEADGRMFPTTDDSQTIIDALLAAHYEKKIQILRGVRVETFSQTENGKWLLSTSFGEMEADRLMIATGSSIGAWDILADLGYKIVPAVPSLFTFNISDNRLIDMQGISFGNVEISVLGTKLKSSGALLITHWGLSGPAVLRLSAWGARELAEKKHRFSIKVNFTNGYNMEETVDILNENKVELAKKTPFTTPQFQISQRFWRQLLTAAQIPEMIRWADLSKKQIFALAEQLTNAQFEVNGKSTFKDEFVTAGGVDLKEIDFKTFESKRHKGLYFAGEVLNIDAITGGFNFQAAWTGGWHVGNAISNPLE